MTNDKGTNDKGITNDEWPNEIAKAVAALSQVAVALKKSSQEDNTFHDSSAKENVGRVGEMWDENDLRGGIRNTAGESGTGLGREGAIHD